MMMINSNGTENAVIWHNSTPEGAAAIALLFCINQAKLICRWLPNGVLAALCNFHILLYFCCYCPGTLASGLLSTKVHGVQATSPHLSRSYRLEVEFKFYCCDSCCLFAL